MRKWLMFVLVLFAGVFGITVLLAQTPPSPEQQAAADANTLKVVAQNWQFDKQEYHVKKGSTMKVELVLREGVHGLGIPDYNVALKGDNLSQEVTFDKAGTFDMHCIVLCGTGHANMKAKLIVE